MFAGPGFVDHHAHAFAHRAVAGVLRCAGDVRDWHGALERDGSNPADAPADELPAPERLIASIVSTQRLAASLGLVEIWEAGLAGPGLLEALLRLRGHVDRFDVRVRILASSGQAATRLPEPTGDPWLDVPGVKFYLDGWLGTRTCAACRPFADEPGNAGILFLDAASLARRIEPVAAAGLKVVMHAIGARAIAAGLDALDAVAAGQRLVPAPRLEHVEDLHAEHIARMAAGGVEACVQPSFASSDAGTLAVALGAGHESAYRWSALVTGGVRVVTGSDYPIEDLDPLVGLRDLVRGPIDPLPVSLAYSMMTDRRAGVTVLSGDPGTMATSDLGQLRVLATDPSPTTG